MNYGLRWEFIYNQINGMNEEDVCAWVKDESTMEGEIGPLTEQIYRARDRVCEKAGIDPEEDADMEILIGGFEDLCRTCGKLMYYYGYQDRDREKEETVDKV